jgi:hypothetical protein
MQLLLLLLQQLHYPRFTSKDETERPRISYCARRPKLRHRTCGLQTLSLHASLR